MIRAVILLTLAACASSKSAEQHAEVAQEAHGETQATQTLQQETHSEEGEWTRRTWEFAPEAKAGRPDMDPAFNRGAAITAPAPAKVAQPSDAGHPSFLGWPTEGDAPLLRYTEETHAPAHVDTSTVAGATQATKQDTSLKAASEDHSASKTSYWPPWWLILGGALAAAGGLWLARGKIAPLLGVLGRLF